MPKNGGAGRGRFLRYLRNPSGRRPPPPAWHGLTPGMIKWTEILRKTYVTACCKPYMCVGILTSDGGGDSPGLVVMMVVMVVSLLVVVAGGSCPWAGGGDGDVDGHL